MKKSIFSIPAPCNLGGQSVTRKSFIRTRAMQGAEAVKVVLILPSTAEVRFEVSW